MTSISTLTVGSIFLASYMASLATAAPGGRNAMDLDPYPTKPKITFSPDGSFKVTVFSDLHFGENPWDSWGPEHDAASIGLMRNVLSTERPDYVVLNGDLITGENTFRENSTTLVDEIVAPLNEAKIPFSSTHGNHDNQANITHMEEIEREQRVSPLSYTRTAPPGVGGAGGPGTYWVPVFTHSTDSAPSLILWFFDSRGGFSAGTGRTPPLEDWVDETVAGWIEEQTALMDSVWGPADTTRGALAFVHIPPHVIQKLQNNLDSVKNPGLNADILGPGTIQDSANGGKDQPFWDSLNTHIKNLHAVVSGHDHGNEWCAREPTKDVIFCFDKHSGYGGYTHDGWNYGVRNFVFTSPDPSQGLDTWIRYQDGSINARVTLDNNYR